MAKSGRERKIYLTTIVDNPDPTPDVITNTWIAGETSNSLDISRETFGGGDKSSKWDNFFAGKGSWSGSASFNLDNSADQEQITLLNSLVAGTKVLLFIGELDEEEKQSDGIGGTAIITSISETNADGSVSSRDISFQGDGTPSVVAPS
jgi:hypothetical protein